MSIIKWKGLIEIIKLLVFYRKRSRLGIVADVLNCDIVVNEFELQSHYYIQFQTNTLAKGMNPLIPLS